MQTVYPLPRPIQAQQVKESDFDTSIQPNPDHVPGVEYNPRSKLARVGPRGAAGNVAEVGDWIFCVPWSIDPTQIIRHVVTAAEFAERYTTASPKDMPK
jgi:hypothetical protein